MQANPDRFLSAGKKVAAPAQRKGNKGSVEKPGNSNVEAVAEQLGQLSTKPEPRPKCKQLDVLQEFENSKRDKKTASFVVVGEYLPKFHPGFSLQSRHTWQGLNT